MGCQVGSQVGPQGIWRARTGPLGYERTEGALATLALDNNAGRLSAALVRSEIRKRACRTIMRTWERRHLVGVGPLLELCRNLPVHRRLDVAQQPIGVDAIHH